MLLPGYLKPATLKNHFSAARHSATHYWPGVVLAICIAFTALFLSSHYGGPAFLFALLVGISVNFVRKEQTFIPGIELTSKTILRTGVALLGMRIGVEEISSLGFPAILLVITALLMTIAFGILVSRLFGQSRKMGLLVGGATAICGASAALAISCCLPNYSSRERDMLFTVVTVTTLSTIAMALYPIITGYLKLNDVQAGIFVGATIHDVAQVVGAGYSISHEAGDIAILTKLVRVAFLVPLVFVLTFVFSANDSNATAGQSVKRVPLFLIAFVVFAAANSFHILPKVITSASNELSRFLLIMSVAAIGTKTYLGDLAETGAKALLLAVVTTVFLALVTSVGLMFL